MDLRRRFLGLIVGLFILAASATDYSRAGSSDRAALLFIAFLGLVMLLLSLFAK